MDPEVDSDFGRCRGIFRNPDHIGSVRYPLEQEESIVISAGFRDDLAFGIDQLEVDTFEPGAAALDQRALDVAAADQADLDIGRHPRARDHDLQRLLRYE